MTDRQSCLTTLKRFFKAIFLLDFIDSMISDNFDLISSEEFSFKGFKFRADKDFSCVEFTQYHDVYYNTGPSSEVQDIECKNYRDCMVGPHRETKSTFSSGDTPTTRIKVLPRRSVESEQKPERRPERKPERKLERKPERKPERRSSPRKKPAGRVEASSRRPPVRRTDERAGSEGGAQEAAGKRKSLGENGELSAGNKTKLRGAVYDVLLKNNIMEATPLFKKCFPKLFRICEMYVLEGPDE